jgi:hypothetical protein
MGGGHPDLYPLLFLVLTLNPNPLHAAFYDGPMLLTSVRVVKEYILVGDVHYSVQFLKYVDKVRDRFLQMHPCGRRERAASFAGFQGCV